MSTLNSIITKLDEIRNTDLVDAYKYHIASCVFDAEGYQVLGVSNNVMPDCFSGTFKPTDEIGDSGTTVHAEMLALLKTHVSTVGKSIMVTDPPCPNCMKFIVMAGISEIYVLESGFNDGLWYNSTDENGVERSRYFDDVSLKIASLAGVAVYRVKENDAHTHLLNEPAKFIAEPASVFTGRYDERDTIVHFRKKAFPDAPYAINISKQDDFCVLVVEAYTPGMNDRHAQEIRGKFDDVDDGLRYRLMMDALSGLLAASCSANITIDPHIYVSELPTSRCIVNSLAYGAKTLDIPQINPVSEKSKASLRALDLLKDKGLL